MLETSQLKVRKLGACELNLMPLRGGSTAIKLSI